MTTPNELDMDEDWADQDILPTDYAQGYDEATTTDVRDDQDEIVEDEMHEIDHPSLEEIATEEPTEVMPEDSRLTKRTRRNGSSNTGEPTNRIDSPKFVVD